MLVGLLDFLRIRGPRFHKLAKALHLGTAEQQKKWNDVLIHLIIGLSDQQLVLGIAMMTVGFIKHSSLLARHFWVVFDLAWFSAVTHLASLPALNIYLIEYPRWRDLRVVLMLVNYILLLAAAVLTFGNYDPKSVSNLVDTVN
jgi:hypothetical protein